jgi:YVTN family beta-propeller protein
MISFVVILFCNFSSLIVDQIDAQSYEPIFEKALKVKVGGSPRDIAVNPFTDKIYVTNDDGSYLTSNIISVIDGKRDELINNIILVKRAAMNIAVNPNTNKIYVTALVSDNATQYYSVSVINGSTYKLSTTIRMSVPMPLYYDGPTDSYPSDIAVNPNTNKIYVINTGPNGTVSVIDGERDELINATIPVGDEPRDIAVNPNTNEVYVTTDDFSGHGTVSVIDGERDEVINTIPVGDSPGDIAVNPNTNKIYVGFNYSNKFCVIENKNENIICSYNNQYNGFKINLNLNLKADTIYLSNFDTSVVSVINGSTYKLSATIPLGDTADDLAVNPNTNKIYVTNYGSGTVSVLDGNIEFKGYYIDKFSKTGINVKLPSNMAVNPNTNKIYVINGVGLYDNGNGTVSVIDGERDELSATIPVGDSPFDIAVNPNTNKIYVTNYGSGTVSVIDGERDELINATIPVGDSPFDIAVNPNTNKIYVINTGPNGTVSVIDGERDEVINATIPVGDSPGDIAVNPNTNKIYVVNFNNVSIIDGKRDELINATIPLYEGDELINATIPLYGISGISGMIVVNPSTDLIYVINRSFSSNNYTISIIDGERDELINSIVSLSDNPIDMAVNPNTNKIYVTIYGGIVSVIDGEINQISSTIPVGDSSQNIVVNPDTNIIYVANHDVDRILLIEDEINKVILSRFILFNVSPSNSGTINCDGKEIVTNQTLLDQEINLPFGTKCIAKANDGFHFSSWVENIKKNAIRTINSSTSNSDSSFPFFAGILGSNSVDEASIFTITESKSGSFTANFKEVAPPIPNEYLIPLYGIIASTIIGWSIPSIIGWIKTRTDVRKLNYYHKKIHSLYDDGKLDENDIEPLNKLKGKISDSYSQGKINAEHYSNLKDEISLLYQELFKKRIHSLNHVSNNEDMQKQVEKIKDDIDDAYSKAKITELHYNLLNKQILEYENKYTDEEK